MKKVIPLQGYHRRASKTRLHSRGAVILFFENPAKQAIETMRAPIIKFLSPCPSGSKLWYSRASQAAATGIYLKMFWKKKLPKQKTSN